MQLSKFSSSVCQMFGSFAKVPSFTRVGVKSTFCTFCHLSIQLPKFFHQSVKRLCSLLNTKFHRFLLRQRARVGVGVKCGFCTLCTFCHLSMQLSKFCLCLHPESKVPTLARNRVFVWVLYALHFLPLVQISTKSVKCLCHLQTKIPDTFKAPKCQP